MYVITLNEDEEGGRRPRNGREGREAATEGRASVGRGGLARVGGLAARAGDTGRRAFIRLCRATDQSAVLPR